MLILVNLRLGLSVSRMKESRVSVPMAQSAPEPGVAAMAAHYRILPMCRARALSKPSMMGRAAKTAGS